MTRAEAETYVAQQLKDGVAYVIVPTSIAKVLIGKKP